MSAGSPRTTWLGPSAATRPSSRTTVRGHTSSTSSRSWVAISLVQLNPRMSWMNLPAGPRVEIRGRLVENEDRRLAREHAGQASTFSLAKAQVMRRSIGERGQLHPRQALECNRPGIALALALIQGSERDVAQHGVAEELVIRILKHEPDAPARPRARFGRSLQCRRSIPAARVRFAGRGRLVRCRARG